MEDETELGEVELNESEDSVKLDIKKLGLMTGLIGVLFLAVYFDVSPITNSDRFVTFTTIAALSAIVMEHLRVGLYRTLETVSPFGVTDSFKENFWNVATPILIGLLAVPSTTLETFFILVASFTIVLYHSTKRLEFDMGDLIISSPFILTILTVVFAITAVYSSREDQGVALSLIIGSVVAIVISLVYERMK